MVKATVKATVTSHRCDDRCYYAKGTICRCACGGANHGCGLIGERDDDAEIVFSDGATLRRHAHAVRRLSAPILVTHRRHQHPPAQLALELW